MRSRTGWYVPPCLEFASRTKLISNPSQTCRQRKLKCDEEKPICGQCRKGSRECRPSDGVVFRHQQNASMNAAGDEEAGERTGRLGSFYAYKNTFNESNVWVDIPKNGISSRTTASRGVKKILIAGSVTFLNITDPFNMEATPEPEDHAASTPIVVPRLEEGSVDNYPHISFDDAPGLEALSAAATNNYDYIRPLSNHASSPGDPLVSHPPSNNLNFILNPTVPDGNLGSCCGVAQFQRLLVLTYSPR